MAAGALWGGIFLAPELVWDFSPLQLTVGRYVFYGVIAAVLITFRWRRVKARLTRREVVALVWLSLFGNIFYYILVGSAVQIGGIAMTSLVIGFMPVAVTIIGSRDSGAVPVVHLIPSLILGAVGIVCIGWQALAVPSERPLAESVIGLICAIGALGSWTTYAVGNSRWLARLEDLSVNDWNLLTGVVTGGLALAVLPLALLTDHTPHDGSSWLQFATVAASVAVSASIIGNAFWNKMSRLLPLTMVGQMILFETLFALLYGFLWERRLPTTLEVAALVCIILSVLSCVRAHRPR